MTLSNGHSSASRGAHFLRWQLPALLGALLIVLGRSPPAWAYNGDADELECPEECECRFFRVNWVTDCSESNLTEIPFDEISPSVYILDLNGNHIVDPEPFPAGIKLRRLQLAHNHLPVVRREWFAELEHIIDADFAGNRIRWIDPFTFADKAGFLTLELQDNPLDRIDGPFLYSITLLYLDISNCQLEQLPAAFFRNISSLSTLDLSHNPLVALNASALAPLMSLSMLKMNFCNLSSMDTNAFQHQINLRFLELAGNQFKQVVWPLLLRPLARLEFIDLRRSGLTSQDIPAETFYSCMYLSTVILAENQLSELDVSATIGNKLQHLEHLDLSHCGLAHPLSEDAFANATKLKSLYLSGNALHAPDLLLALAPLTRLQKLSLSHSGLEVLPDTFDKFPSLKELDISHNPLGDVFVKLLAPVDTLEYLNMGYSNLSHISPTSFTKMTSLKRLVLSGNELHSLEAGLFANLTHLASLELNFCGLRRPLNATVFFSGLTYTDLTELQLAGNPLQVSPSGALLPRQLSLLETLDLSNCNLTFLPADAFTHTTKIRTLILAGNRFGAAGEMNFLQLLPQLDTLDLRFNNLTSFPIPTIASNSNVRKLKLVANPWRCDCWLSEFWSWVLDTRGNLDLEGATIEDGDISAGKSKRKKLLICMFDDKSPKSPAKIRRGKAQRNISASANRTWAKYVRESGCIQTGARRAKRHIGLSGTNGHRTVEEELLSSANHVPNTWAHHLMIATGFYFAGLLLIYIVFSIVAARGNRKQAQAKRAK